MKKKKLFIFKYLSKCAELHDDPHRILCDYSHQLYNVRMVELTHSYCKKKNPTEHTDQTRSLSC